MKATIYDVAREAGVSIATVSQVINGKGKISEERRREIVGIMERLHYEPSVIAAALTGKRTYTLGLLVQDIANPLYAEIARAVEDQGHRMGYSFVICSTDNKDERAERYLSQLRQKSVDGIVLGTGIANKELLQPLLNESLPVVLIAHDMPLLDVNTVLVDDAVGGAMAARHLLQLGHRRFAVLAEHRKASSSRERLRGFRQALEEADIALPDSAVLHGEASVADGRRHALELLTKAERPTALFCCSDLLAIGSMRAARELGLRVPEELSVVGFDNTVLASVTEPALTTVAQPIEAMGRRAVELLLQELTKAESFKQRVVLRPGLIVRQSTSAL